LTAVNLNPKYLSCVPYFIDFWVSLRASIPGVTYVPKVLVLAESLPSELKEYEKWCELFVLEPGISSTFGSQAVRILKPSLQDADYIITTDVDMLPMSDKVFAFGLESIAKGAEFVICRDVLPVGQYPICYNLASPETWKKLTNIDSVESVHKLLSKWFERVASNDQYLGVHGGAGWFADQEALFEMVDEFEKRGGRVDKLRDRKTGHKRLDRLFMPFPLNWLTVPMVCFGSFTDYHVHHPVNNYTKFISFVLKCRDSQVKRAV